MDVTHSAVNTTSGDRLSLSKEKLSILIVDDQRSYRELIEEVITELFRDIQITFAKNGIEAWDLLEESLKTQGASQAFPSLIITDLNLPKLSGLDLLTRIKTSSKLQKIPVIILSTSKDDREIFDCYKAQANCFITKPQDIEDLVEVIRRTLTFLLHKLNH